MTREEVVGVQEATRKKIDETRPPPGSRAPHLHPALFRTGVASSQRWSASTFDLDLLEMREIVCM